MNKAQTHDFHPLKRAHGAQTKRLKAHLEAFSQIIAGV